MLIVPPSSLSAPLLKVIPGGRVSVPPLTVKVPVLKKTLPAGVKAKGALFLSVSDPALEEGADADLLVLAGDPRDDLGVLRIPIAIVLRGRTI